MDQLQIVHENDICFHSEGLCLDPRHTLASCGTDEQRPALHIGQPVKFVHGQRFIFDRRERSIQLVGNQTGLQCGRVCFQREITHTLALLGHASSKLEAQSSFACAWSAADHEIVAGHEVQVFVQLGQAGADVLGFLVQMPDIIIQQIAHALKIILLGVDIQRLPHLLVKIRQIIKGGCSIHSPKGKALETGLCGILHDDPRPLFHAVTGQPDALTLTGGHAGQQVLLLVWVFCRDLHDIQQALCDPEPLHGCKGGLQFRPEMLNAQLRQGIRCQLIVH